MEEKITATRYLATMFETASAIRATDRGCSALGIDHAVDAACGAIMKSAEAGGTVFFIGNGGSSAIASHLAVDFMKNGGIRSLAFNDSAFLTCIGNDLGYGAVFEKPISMFARKGDMLVAISSSGRSENILRGVEAARAAGCGVISMSGFSDENPLCGLGDVNFHVPSHAYGYVEILHTALCHCILDIVMVRKGLLKRADLKI